MSTIPRLKPWALGWLADREYFIELGRELNLCKGPDADNKIKLEATAIRYVASKTWWPNLMQCVVGGSSELVFAVYVDYKRRAYPPPSIPRSELLPRKFCERLEAYLPLDDDPQWFTCMDGSYTPWRYGGQEPSPNAVWMDVSIYQPHPEADYDRIELVEEDEYDAEEYYDEQFDSGVMDVGEHGEEYLDGADPIEEEDDYADEECATEGTKAVNCRGA